MLCFKSLTKYNIHLNSAQYWYVSYDLWIQILQIQVRFKLQLCCQLQLLNSSKCFCHFCYRLAHCISYFISSVANGPILWVFLRLWLGLSYNLFLTNSLNALGSRETLWMQTCLLHMWIRLCLSGMVLFFTFSRKIL